MKLCKNWKNTLGLTSLSLLMLSGCSNSEPKVIERYQTVPKTPLLCPEVNLCQMPQVRLKTNKDLTLALDKALTTIEFCQAEIQALTQCIETHNAP